MITRKVLIVEDEPAIALTFEHILRRSLEYNYQTKSVTSAEDALDALAKDGPFDVILLDYYLPGQNGAEFLKTLRSADMESVVVCISGSQEYKVVHDVFKLGADDYLTKDEVNNPYVLEKTILAGLEKRQYQRQKTKFEIASQRLDAIMTIIRTIHHELNNPMAIVRFAASKLANSRALANDQEASQYLTEINQNVNRMTDVLRKLPQFRDEIFNEQLRGLKLYALPEEPPPPEES